MEMNKNLYTSNFNVLVIFAKRCILFLLLLVIVALIMFLINRQLIDSHPYRVNNNIVTVITGDSHTDAALSPIRIGKSVNISKKAEPTFESFYKIKHVLMHNDNIQNVVVGFSYHNLSEFNDRKLSDETWAYEVLNRSYPILEIGSLRTILEINWLTYFDIICKNELLSSDYYTNKFLGIDKGNPPFVGAYQNNRTKSANVSKKWLEARINRHFFVDSKESEISSVTMAYLDSLAMLSTRYNINLYFINLPLHRKYREKIPKKFKKSFGDLKLKLEKNPKVKVIQMAYMLDSVKYFTNYDHVNAYGAKKASNRLRKILYKK